MKNRYPLVLFVLLQISMGSLAQAPINILSVQQGLPKSQIYDIAQDSLGFLWIGTRDGLVRYDGHHSELYRKGDSPLMHNYIFDLYLDAQQNLWMASNADYSGVTCLHIPSQTFSSISSRSHPNFPADGIVGIDQLDDTTLVFASKNFHLILFNPATEQIRSWNLNNLLPSGMVVTDVSDVMVDPLHNGIYWIGAREALFRFDSENSSLTSHYQNTNAAPVNFYCDSISLPYAWIAMDRAGGLLKLNLESQETQGIFHPWDQENIEQDNFDAHSLIVIARRSPTQLFVGGRSKGLGLFDTETKVFDFGTHEVDALSSETIRALHINADSELWIGTDQSGLHYLRSDIAHWSVNLYPDALDRTIAFQHRRLHQLDPENYLLACYQLNELWLWNKSSDRIDNIELPRGVYLLDLIDYGSEVLLGSNSGLFVYSQKTRTVMPFASENASMIFNDFKSHSSGIWFINWGEGIGVLNDSLDYITGAGSSGLRHRWTHDLTFGPRDQLWIGQQDGLYSLDPKTYEITEHSSSAGLNGFENSNFKALVFDEYGRLWIGQFGGGLYCYDIEIGAVIGRVDIATGMPSDRIYDMILDCDGFLWAWTSEGLISLYPENNLDSISIQYYPETKFFPVARVGTWFSQLDSVHIFLGLHGGSAHFNARALRQESKRLPQPPIISRLVARDVTYHLPNHGYLEDKKIQLTPLQNFLQLDFTAPKDGFLSRQKFRYRMMGFDEEWVNAGNSRKATYSQLDPGDYHFQVSVQNESGLWSPPGQPLFISLPPRWYMTKGAITLWVLFSFLIAFGIFYFFYARRKIRARLQSQIQEARQLRELDQTKSQFFAQISHEFRTPLTVIMGVIEQMRKKVNLPQLADGFDAVERNSHLLLKQITQILNLSKLKSQYIELQPEQGEVLGFLSYLFESLTNFASERGIDFQFRSDSSEIFMDFDKEKLQDIFLNLVGNALKFTAPGGSVEICIAETKIDGAGFFQLQVSDTGSGIDEEDLDLIFEPYQQGSNPGIKGTGLGLATVKHWVQAMGGTVMVESTVGQGSSFTVQLPITREASFAQPSPTPLKPSIEKSQLQILIIEDNADVVNYLKLCLEAYLLLVASNGEDGIRLAKKSLPDLIISDLMMPKKDGFAVCAELKSNKLTNHIPIIVLSAKNSQQDRNAALRLGADAYLVKPFNQDELLLRIQGLMSQRSMLQEKYGQPSKGVVAYRKDANDDFLDKIDSLVMDHLDQSYSVEDLANSIGISRVQLYRKLKAITGKSVSVYVRMIKLLEGRRKLLATNLSISEIAYSVGFSDPSYFSKTFKEMFGESPTDVRSVK